MYAKSKEENKTIGKIKKYAYLNANVSSVNTPASVIAAGTSNKIVSRLFLKKLHISPGTARRRTKKLCQRYDAYCDTKFVAVSAELLAKLVVGINLCSRGSAGRIASHLLLYRRI